MKTRSDTSPTEGAQRPDHRRHAGAPRARADSRVARRRAPVHRAATGRGPRPPADADPSDRLLRDGSWPGDLVTRYEPCLDGLFTYCLSVLCDHDAATTALADLLAMADRHRPRLRDSGLTRPWLYALARYVCLHRLSTGQEARPAATDQARSVPGEVARRRRRELAALAWPEAAGIRPDQREALELAVRHGLSPREVGAVLRLDADEARALLSGAAREVERTREALAVVELGGCPALGGLAGDTEVLLGTALRRELVRHLDDCPDCRSTARRVTASGRRTATRTPEVLAVLQAPRAALLAALVGEDTEPAPRPGSEGVAGLLGAGHAGGSGRAPGSASRGRPSPLPVPRLDRRGFPLDSADRAARRAALRHRAVATTVVAAVVAAPVLALWAAYRGGQDEATGHEVGVSQPEGDFQDGFRYERTNGEDGAHGADTPGPRNRAKRHAHGSIKAADASADRKGPSGTPEDPASSAESSAAPGTARGAVRPDSPAAGRLTVTARAQGDSTVVTLSASGDAQVSWSVSTRAAWLVISETSGVLQPGESTTITVSTDPDREPAGPWTASLLFEPSGYTLTIQGAGPAPEPSETPSGSASPSAQPDSPSPS